jgi:hypothetical protein
LSAGFAVIQMIVTDQEIDTMALFKRRFAWCSALKAHTAVSGV